MTIAKHRYPRKKDSLEPHAEPLDDETTQEVREQRARNAVPLAGLDAKSQDAVPVKEDGLGVRQREGLPDGEASQMPDAIRSLRVALEAAIETLSNMHNQQTALVDHVNQLLASDHLSLERRATRLLMRALGFGYRARREFAPRSYRFEAVPLSDLRRVGSNRWRSLGSDPHFELISNLGKVPSGDVRVDFEITSDSLVGASTLYFDKGQGFRETNKVALPSAIGGHVRGLVHLPAGTRALRLDPANGPGEFALGRLTMRELTFAEATFGYAIPKLRQMFEEPERLAQLPGRLVDVVRNEGPGGVLRRLRGRARGSDAEMDYKQWVDTYDSMTPVMRRNIQRRIAGFSYLPTISVVVPVWNTPERWLRAALNSVRNQLYPAWELCIADDASSEPHVRKILAEYAGLDERIKVVFRDTNGHISAASNSALELVSGDFVTFLDHDDELAEHALFAIVETLNRRQDLDLIYSDEDKIDQRGKRFDPAFKPDWSPELLRQQNYICHLTAYRTELVRKAGGLRIGLEGSQDHDLVLRVSELTSPDRICHIPAILYHWRSIPGSIADNTSVKPYAQTAGERAVRDSLLAKGVDAHVASGAIAATYRVHYALPVPPPLVSIIIPTRDRHDLLRQCIGSIQARSSYTRYELIVVDNQSEELETLAYLRELGESGTARVLNYNRPFNYSALNNEAVKEAKGELICLLNNDVEVLSSGWLTELVGLALQPGVGAVGAKLYYPDGTIQHAGVVTGLFGLAGHAYRFSARGTPGYFGQLLLAREVSAVTAACLVVRRSTFLEVGGLNEVELKVAFNDVDFCLRVRELGYRNMWTPYAELVHHESATRGSDEAPEKRLRFARETAYMRKRWAHVLPNDPHHNPNLALDTDVPTPASPPRYAASWRESTQMGASHLRAPSRE
jgi:O-antigen biosynthesis protein